MGKQLKSAENTASKAKLKMQLAILKQLIKTQKKSILPIVLVVYCLITGAVINIQFLIRLIQNLF